MGFSMKEIYDYNKTLLPLLFTATGALAGCIIGLAVYMWDTDLATKQSPSFIVVRVLFYFAFLAFGFVAAWLVGTVLKTKELAYAIAENENNINYRVDNSLFGFSIVGKSIVNGKEVLIVTKIVEVNSGDNHINSVNSNFTTNVGGHKESEQSFDQLDKNNKNEQPTGVLDKNSNKNSQNKTNINITSSSNDVKDNTKSDIVADE